MMTSTPAPALAEQTDIVASGPAARLAACTDLLAPLSGGATLPPLWHWLLFLPSAPAAELGADGHRLQDGLLAHDPALPARMWAGGRLQLHRQPAFGVPVTRRSSVLHTRDRQGSSGKLRFVTLHHQIGDASGPLLEEEQDLVFRAPAPPRASAGPAPAAPPGAVTHTLTPDAVLLFRFSALTFNAHRIHYDREYARQAEHYPDLVVHGPLQAILLAALLHRAMPAGVLRRFEFRGHAPAFVGHALALEAWRDPQEPARWHMRTRDSAAALCMTAQAEFELPRAPGHGEA